MTDEKVLELVKGWDWGYFDPDGILHEKPKSLSDAVTKLAMAGDYNPPETLLKLLASGHLIATGIWNWHAYRGQEYYQDEGNGLIPQMRWEYALGVIEAMDALPVNHSYDPYVNLKEVGQGKTNKLFWNWRNNEFAIADADIFFVHGMDEYQEEWFSARDLDVSLTAAYWVDGDLLLQKHDPAVSLKNAETAAEISFAKIEKNKGGPPTKYDWERAAAAIVLKWAVESTWRPDSQGEVARAITAWFAEKDEFPSENLIKQRARWIYPMLKEQE